MVPKTDNFSHEREAALTKIKEKNDSVGTKNLVYKSKTAETQQVYRIPVKYLIFNQYNGRIGTYVQQEEKIYGPIDATTEAGEKIIMEFLWDSKVDRNKTTKKSLKIQGQIEPGIVTRDGVIIDGNRRCMLLKKLAEENNDLDVYFNAVILDDTLQSDPTAIRQLETMFQMGVDAKVDYNPIEKYLKTRELMNDGFSDEKIAELMGVKKTDPKKFMHILELMDEYLESIDADYIGMYRILDEFKVEGALVDLSNFVKKHERGSSGKDWEPDASDIDDFKQVYFSALRTGMDSKDLRILDKLFNYRARWEAISGRYLDRVDEISEGESSFNQLRQDNPDEHPMILIRSKEKEYRNNTRNDSQKIVDEANYQVSLETEKEMPEKLLRKALEALQGINTKQESFRGDGLKDLCNSIGAITSQLSEVLSHKSSSESQ